MRRLAPPLLLLGIALAAAGCGEDDRSLIDDARSQELTAAVDRIEAACQDQDVAAAQTAVDEASAQVSELPRRVDDGLQDNLREWLDHISGRLDRDCAPDEEEEETPTPEPTPTATETPEPTPTEAPEPTPTPEEEEPPPEEVPPPPEEEQPPPEGDQGGGVPAPDVPGEAP